MNPSYRYCHALTRRTAANFYPAFLVLPRDQRRAMEAMYAFLRIADDLADEPGADAAKIERVRAWRAALDAALAGRPSHPLHPALADTVRRHGISVQYLHAVLDGVESDLRPVAVATFGELYLYCYRVASAVGLACIHVWGFTGDRAAEYAEAAGIAFQLTNILRDLGEDRTAGRVYLPMDECARFGCPPESWRAGDPAFRAMMEFQVARARAYYATGRRLLPLLSPAGRAIFGAMAATYEGLLNEIESRGYDVFRERVRVPGWKKTAFLLRAFPVRWGWA